MKEAILVIDMLKEFVTGRLGFERAKRIVPKIKRLLELARSKGIRVFYVCDSHEPKDPELELWGPHALRGSDGAKVVPELEPEKSNRVIPKRAYSGFFKTKLDGELQRLDVKKLVLTGVCTEICVQNTAVDAFHRGYGVAILRDCVASPDPRAHRRSLDYSKRICGAEIITSNEWIKRLGG